VSILLPVDPGLVAVFAASVGDLDEEYWSQIGAPLGRTLLVPLTYTRAVAQHFDRDGELRAWPGGEPTPEGGGSGRLHAEQHFEYFRPLRTGETLTATTYGESTWSKQGRSGGLDFAETITDFRGTEGDLVVRTRRVSVRQQEHADG
jgi:hypothetical protein